ncbi:MAG: hypothetical protein ABF384_10735 [Verrucomicrobiales bacterium]
MSFQNRILSDPQDPSPAISLLAMWIAAADGSIDREEEGLVGELTGYVGLGHHRRLALQGYRKPIQLACEVLRNSPQKTRVMALGIAIKVAAADRQITREEVLILRFLGDLLADSDTLHALYQGLTGQDLPELPGPDDFVAETADPNRNQHRLKLVCLVARLRCELMLSPSPWWNESYQQYLGNWQRKGLEQPRLMRRSEVRKIQHFLLKCGALVAVAVIFLAYKSYNPSTSQFKRALKNDTAEAYQAFLEKFPDSKEASSARGEIHRLKEPATWASAKQADTFESLCRYRAAYPDGKHSEEAGARLETLETPELNAAIAAKDLPALVKLQKRYELLGTVKNLRQRSKTAIEVILNDPDWLLASGSIKECLAFLDKNQDHPRHPEIEKRVIDLEVAQIVAGKHGQLPSSTTVSGPTGGENSTVTIENSTGYELTIRYSGKNSLKMIIPKDEKAQFQITNGSYTVAASVDAASVENYVGSEKFAGSSYFADFSIRISGMPRIEDILPNLRIPGR